MKLTAKLSKIMQGKAKIRNRNFRRNSSEICKFVWIFNPFFIFRRLAVGGWQLVVGGWRVAVGGWRAQRDHFSGGTKKYTKHFQTNCFIYLDVESLHTKRKSSFLYTFIEFVSFFGVWRLAVGMRVGRKIENNNKLKNTKFWKTIKNNPKKKWVSNKHEKNEKKSKKVFMIFWKKKLFYHYYSIGASPEVGGWRLAFAGPKGTIFLGGQQKHNIILKNIFFILYRCRISFYMM